MKSSGKEDPEILFCDNHLLVANKPSGLLTQPDDTGRASLEGYCKEWVKREFHKPGNVFLHCIHRLDRPVFGLVLFARTSKALSRLNELSRDQKIRRIYTAEVEGVLHPKEGRLEHWLIHSEHKALLAKSGDPKAKQALLTYRVLEYRDHATLVSIELQTGRYHQIRAQFAAIGHPVLGDVRYGASPRAQDEIRLGCTEISLSHPVTKEMNTFSISY